MPTRIVPHPTFLAVKRQWLKGHIAWHADYGTLIIANGSLISLERLSVGRWKSSPEQGMSIRQSMIEPLRSLRADNRLRMVAAQRQVNGGQFSARTSCT